MAGHGTRRKVHKMKMSYNKLWKLLIDKQLKKSDLRTLAGISSSSLAKLGKDENVTTEVLVRICNALQCDVSDIMEFVPPIDKSAENEEES
jgi:DNA-binding Xre family transcriptional regulator